MSQGVETENGSYLVVFSKSDPGCAYHFPLTCRDEIDGAYHNWVERGIDRVLAFTMCDGDEIIVAVSQFAEIMTSTPEGRRRARERSAARKQEGGFSE